MRNNYLIYIQVSLDGYFAEDNFAMECFKEFDVVPTKKEHRLFWKSFDVVVMNYKFYRSILTHWKTWPYTYGQKIYVMAKRGAEKHQDPNVIFFKGNIEQLDATIEGNKQVMVIPAFKLFHKFLTMNVIDQMYIYTYPVTFGQGHLLFHNAPVRKFKLIEVKKYNDVIRALYQKK